MILKEHINLLTRAELKELSGNQFKDGELIICGKYYIKIKYGQFKYPIKTTVSTRDNLIDMRFDSWPQYIKDFISRKREAEVIEVDLITDAMDYLNKMVKQPFVDEEGKEVIEP